MGALPFGEELRSSLDKRGIRIDVRSFETLDSTNTEAKRMVRAGAVTPCLIAAREQSGGRGRMGRSFYSPNQTGAYFSILYRPTVAVDAAVTVTGATSVAVLRAIRRLTGKTCGIKWVNDLYLDGRKVCGILTECVSDGSDPHIIVGIGINISTSFDGTELSQIAGSLKDVALSPEEMIAAVTEELLPILERPTDTEWLSDYRAHSIVIGRRISFLQNGRERMGTVRSIEDDGALSVITEDGETVRLFSGEISLRMQ